SKTAIPFVVTAETGVHPLRIHFCGDWATNPLGGLSDCVTQLLKARLFPCTFEETASAITFNALKQFQIHHLESKVAAYDYCGSLRRITDNAFTLSVLVSVCPYAVALGLMSLINVCRHLRQQRDTIDGNFHCTKSAKNTDPTSRSLYEGTGFFPTATGLTDHLKRAPPLKNKGNLNCNYLKVVNNQDRKKWKNMEITGIVNVQCSHVFIKASVDLQYGERYANVDFGLALSIRQKLPRGVTPEMIAATTDFTGYMSIDKLDSYNAACQYSTGIVERFMVHSPDLVPIIKKIQWAVPALHINGHKESCIYLFGTCYKKCTGHFHGETAKFYWPELNQIGPQVTQMSASRRQDVISLNHNNWNYKKMAKTCTYAWCLSAPGN
ncbi:hypothetical protein B0H12DRAFT_1039135, partial [Mycena haematopus]